MLKVVSWKLFVKMDGTQGADEKIILSNAYSHKVLKLILSEFLFIKYRKKEGTLPQKTGRHQLKNFGKY